MKPLFWSCFACLFLTPTYLSFAGVANVIDAKTMCHQNSTCDFTVTVQHEDTGWDHYANQWEVLSMEGEVLGERVLLHPHVNEQPFTRSLSGVSIPSSIQSVKIRARDSVHGFGGKEVVIYLER